MIRILVAATFSLTACEQRGRVEFYRFVSLDSSTARAFCPDGYWQLGDQLFVGDRGYVVTCEDTRSLFTETYDHCGMSREEDPCPGWWDSHRKNFPLRRDGRCAFILSHGDFDGECASHWERWDNAECLP